MTGLAVKTQAQLMRNARAQGPARLAGCSLEDTNPPSPDPPDGTGRGGCLPVEQVPTPLPHLISPRLSFPPRPSSLLTSPRLASCSPRHIPCSPSSHPHLPPPSPHLLPSPPPLFRSHSSRCLYSVLSLPPLFHLPSSDPFPSPALPKISTRREACFFLPFASALPHDLFPACPQLLSPPLPSSPH